MATNFPLHLHSIKKIMEKRNKTIQKLIKTVNTTIYKEETLINPYIQIYR